ncbi:MAG TPA: TerC family protein [Clostridia bacterium]|nr:TerC family protein [Clostridia bacterium]
MPSNWLFWILFNVFVLAMLALDLGVFNRKAHVVRFREAITWTVVWISLAAVFAVLLYFFGHTMTGHANRPSQELSLEFITGYLIEEALSVDNLFVFLLIFRYFKVPGEFQHKVLFWGIIGALVMRALFIAAGVSLITRFHWIIYVFGVFLIYTGIKLFTQKEAEIDPGKNPLVSFFRKYMRVTPEFEGGRFFVQKHGRGYATPLALVLLVVETTDVIFAADSIPAILAITREPFIVYTSNVFAILGLRSLYFALSGMMELFHLLHYGLSIILMFIGTKMLISSYVKIPVAVALGVVAGVLALSVMFSLMFPAKPAPEFE